MAKRGDSIPEVRITVWPGSPLPVPPVIVHSVDLIEDLQLGQFLLFAQDARRSTNVADMLRHREVQIRDELFLRELFDLDISDTRQIVAFSAAYGRLGSHGWKDLPIDKDNFELAHPMLKKMDDQRDQLFTDYKIHPGDIVHLASVDEIVQHAAVLRDVVRIWLSLKGEIDFVTVVNQWENRIWPSPINKSISVEYLEEFLNAGLQPFQAHIKVEHPETDRPNFFSATPRYTHVSLYSVLCLQLANHIAENADYRHCANEPCGRVFSRQRGRAKFGQFKTKNLKYCSSYCARAQVQRELRRRQTRARQLHREGSSPKAIAKELKTELENVNRWIGADKRKPINASSSRKKQEKRR